MIMKADRKDQAKEKTVWGFCCDLRSMMIQQMIFLYFIKKKNPINQMLVKNLNSCVNLSVVKKTF